MTGRGRWRLAGLFLAVLIALMLSAWLIGGFPGETSMSNLFEAAILAGPVLAAAIAGAVWRGRLPASPDWATRRPYGRLMGWLLFAISLVGSILLLFFLFLWQPIKENGDFVGTVLAALTSGFDIEAIFFLTVSLVVQLLICMIQTEIGLFLGVRIKDLMMQHKGQM